MNFECEFTRDRPLPIVAIDDPIYRRLPAFLIATVDNSRLFRGSGRKGACSGAWTGATSSGSTAPAEPGAGTAATTTAAGSDHSGRASSHLWSTGDHRRTV